MACASCAAKQANRNLLAVSRSVNRSVSAPTEDCYPEEQIEVRISELEELLTITTNRASKHVIRVKLFKLRKILKFYSTTDCNQYKALLNELL